MKQSYIIHEHHPRLLLFFAGWGADETPFKMYRPVASDFMVCYDYRTLDFDASGLEAIPRKSTSVGMVYGGMGGFADRATALIARYVRRRYPYWQTASPSTERPTPISDQHMGIPDPPSTTGHLGRTDSGLHCTNSSAACAPTEQPSKLSWKSPPAVRWKS